MKVRKGDYNTNSQPSEKVDWRSACQSMLSLPAARYPLDILLNAAADENAIWFNLPSFSTFLASLCSCGWLHSEISMQEATRLKAHAACVLALLQHALCVILLGCDPSLSSPHRTLFASPDCSCFLPLAGANSSARCFTCGRDPIVHVFPQVVGVASDEFLLELCRVGSVGWDPHQFMKAVHQRPHLGVRTGAAYSEADVLQSQALFEEHARQLLQGGVINCQECRNVTLLFQQKFHQKFWFSMAGKCSRCWINGGRNFNAYAAILSSLLDLFHLP